MNERDMLQLEKLEEKVLMAGGEEWGEVKESFQVIYGFLYSMVFGEDGFLMK